MIPQRPAFFPENAGVRPDPRFIPSAGGAQWQGTRQEQNDVLFLSDYDPMKGLLVALADGIGLGADAGKAAAAAVNAIRQDYMRERMLNIIADSVKRIVPREMLKERILKFKITL